MNEKILGLYLQEIFSTFEIVHDKKVPNSNVLFRPDYRIEELVLIFEFDGYGHFTNIKTIMNDKIKDKLYKKMGYTVIRIPYFIQLTEDVLKFIFQKYNNSYNYKTISSTYPHGFIDKKATPPSCFCHQGILNYKNYLNVYQQIPNIISDINKSLENLINSVKNELLIIPYKNFI